MQRSSCTGIASNSKLLSAFEAHRPCAALRARARKSLSTTTSRTLEDPIRPRPLEHRSPRRTPRPLLPPHLACALAAFALVGLSLALGDAARAAPAPDKTPTADPLDADRGELERVPVESLGDPPEAAEPGEDDAGDGDDAEDEVEAGDEADDDGADEHEGAEHEDAEVDLQDPDMCPALFGDAETRDYNSRVREAKLTWLETRGDVVEITHTTDWKRPFYLELAGVELVETELDERGEWSAVVEVDERMEDCPAGQYPVEDDFALGKQARVVGVVDGAMLVEFEGDLAYLMTEDAEIPTWQMVWRSGWYFIRRREVSATKARKRSRTRRSRNRSRNRRSRNRRSRRR